MHYTLPKIYPITDVRLSGISHTEQVRRLVRGGARLIQLREKEQRVGEWVDDAREALAAAREAGAQLIINDRADLALAIGADGVHLGQDDLPPDEARKLLGPHAIIGLSTHSLKQAIAAVDSPVDYIGVGPIFATDTKTAAGPAVGLELLTTIRKAVGDLKIVAIGGIGREDLIPVLSAGADAAAMIGAINSDPDLIEERMASLIHLLTDKR